MFTFIYNKKVNIALRGFVTFIITTFIASMLGPIPNAHAEFFLNLPQPRIMVKPIGAFSRPVLAGIKISPINPLQFNFLIQPGDQELAKDDKKSEYTKLVKYFMASLTTPEKDMWVNLSPYENNKIISDNFAQTEMGRDLLAQDYILKQITASLMYPQDALGKKFWDKVYSQAKEKFGTTSLPVNTFNKVWIVPSKATIFEKGNVAMVVDTYMKVMLEEDYLATQKNAAPPTRGHVQKEQQNVSPSTLPSDAVSTMKAPQVNPQPTTNKLTSQIIKEIIIPELEHEVNTGAHFAQLRQIYHSMVLASWFKKRLKQNILSKVYADSNKTLGIELDNEDDNQKIYDRYLQAYKKGVYNYIKEETDPTSGKMIPRKYFSGGFDPNFSSLAMTSDLKMARSQTEQNPILDEAMVVFGQFNVGEQGLGQWGGNADKQINLITNLVKSAISKYSHNNTEPTEHEVLTWVLNHLNYGEKPSNVTRERSQAFADQLSVKLVDKSNVKAKYRAEERAYIELSVIVKEIQRLHFPEKEMSKPSKSPLLLNAPEEEVKSFILNKKLLVYFKYNNQLQDLEISHKFHQEVIEEILVQNNKEDLRNQFFVHDPKALKIVLDRMMETVNHIMVKPNILIGANILQSREREFLNLIQEDMKDGVLTAKEVVVSAKKKLLPPNRSPIYLNVPYVESLMTAFNIEITKKIVQEKDRLPFYALGIIVFLTFMMAILHDDAPTDDHDAQMKEVTSIVMAQTIPEDPNIISNQGPHGIIQELLIYKDQASNEMAELELLQNRFDVADQRFKKAKSTLALAIAKWHSNNIKSNIATPLIEIAQDQQAITENARTEALIAFQVARDEFKAAAKDIIDLGAQIKSAVEQIIVIIEKDSQYVESQVLRNVRIKVKNFESEVATYAIDVNDVQNSLDDFIPDTIVITQKTGIVEIQGEDWEKIKEAVENVSLFSVTPSLRSQKTDPVQVKTTFEQFSVEAKSLSKEGLQNRIKQLEVNKNNPLELRAYQEELNKRPADQAMNYGGIDFDAKYLEMNIQGNSSMKIPIPKGFEWLENQPIDGFIPNILEINSGRAQSLSFFQGVL